MKLKDVLLPLAFAAILVPVLFILDNYLGSASPAQTKIDYGYNCSLMEASVYRDECYYDAALASKNLSFCELMVLNQSLSSCFRDMAAVLINESLCNLTLNERDFNDCFLGIAKATLKTSYCNLMINSDLNQTEICYSTVAYFSNNSFYCDLITGEFVKDLCYFDLANKTLNLTYCETIASEFMRGNCNNLTTTI